MISAMKSVAQVILALSIFFIAGTWAQLRPCGSYPVDMDCLRDEFVARSGCERRDGPIRPEIFHAPTAQCAFSSFNFTAYKRDLTIYGFENTIVQDFAIWEDEGYSTVFLEYNNFTITGFATGFFHMPNAIPYKVDFDFIENVDEVFSLTIIPGTDTWDLNNGESRPYFSEHWEVILGDSVLEAAAQYEQVGIVVNGFLAYPLRFEMEQGHCFNYVATQIVFNEFICSYEGF